MSDTGHLEDGLYSSCGLIFEIQGQLFRWRTMHVEGIDSNENEAAQFYASNRGNDSITVFGVDRVKGTLSTVQFTPTLGKTPQNSVFDPTGNTVLVANKEPDRINAFGPFIWEGVRSFS